VPQPELVSIADGDSICTLCPVLGGSIIGWSVGGQEMLRRANEAAIASANPLAMASFPLVPFSNRIGYARFVWDGQEIEMTPNFAPEPHAIHGTGWKDAWVIGELSHTQCQLKLHHNADARWPWSFEASQSFRLNENSLEINVGVTNLSDQAAPLAFGHHPYFDQQGAQLSFSATHVFMSGEDALPTDAITPSGEYDFSTGAPVAGRDIDHCYAGWNGRAHIEWTGRAHALDIEADMATTVVYVPKDRSEFCFEPVPHINNALNRPGDLPAMPVVKPGDRYTATIRLTAVRAS
jgi:aldose 1-epimerase